MKLVTLVVIFCLSGALIGKHLESLPEIPIPKPQLPQLPKIPPLTIPPIRPPLNLKRVVTTKYKIIGTSKLALNVILAKYFKDGISVTSTTTTNILIKTLFKSEISLKICNFCNYLNGAGTCTKMLCLNTMALDTFVGQVLSSSWKTLATNKNPAVRLQLQNDPSQWVDFMVSV